MSLLQMHLLIFQNRYKFFNFFYFSKFSHSRIFQIIEVTIRRIYLGFCFFENGIFNIVNTEKIRIQKN